MARKKEAVRLTEGVIWKQIVAFMWPVLLAQLFQEIYGLSNSMIVGNYISTAALSAVSTTQTLLNLNGFFFFGLATGTGIIVGQAYGANRTDDLKKTVGTVITLAVIVGLLFTVFMEVFTPFLFQITNVSTEIYHDAEVYFRVYNLGNIAVLLYSMLFYLLRSIGDSRHPLYYLIVSCVLNLVLGVFFIRALHWEIAGVALATIISQLVVDVLCFRLLFSMDEFRLTAADFRVDAAVTKRIFSIGIPAAVQNMLIALSTMLIQSYINRFSTEAIAGIGVGQRVANWSQMPLLAISTVAVSFVAQNIGAGKYERVSEGIKVCVKLGMAVTAVCVGIIFAFASPLIAMFDSDPEVIRYGTQMCRYMLLSYIPLVWSHVYNGACRGAGNMRIPLIIAVMTQCVFRLVFVYVAFWYVYDIRVIYLSGALCFTLAGIAAYLYFNYSNWTKEHALRS